MKRFQTLGLLGCMIACAALTAMARSQPPTGAQPLTESGLALIRGADATYGQYNANSCEANGVAAAGGAPVVAASSGCNIDNSTIGSQVGCAKCDSGAVGSQGVGKTTVTMGTGVIQQNPTCDLLLKG